MEVKIKRYTSGKRDGTVRKIDVKLDKYDTWSIPWTLSQMLVPMLKQLKEAAHSYGGVDKEDCPAELRSTYDEHGYSKSAYDWLLDELTWTFSEVASDMENEPHIFEDRVYIEGEDFGEHINSLVVIPEKKIEYEAYHKRIANGWRLFGRYGMGLWD